MADSGEFCPVFDRSPVVETRIGLQFAPLVGFQSGHFGLFWEKCLGSKEWRILEDAPALPTETERFGDKRLRPESDLEDDDFHHIRMRLLHADELRSVWLQPNKLFYSWKREKDQRPHYTDVKQQLVALFDRFVSFAADSGLPRPQVNLWEVMYVNLILQGKLWETPADWHRVLPGLFPPGGPRVSGYNWSTFEGTWFFEIPEQAGRVRVITQKVVVNSSDQVALLMKTIARGEVGRAGSGTADWSAGLDVGHTSAIRVFYDLSSPEARQEWGERK